MTFNEYINALEDLPLEWRMAPREDVILAFLGPVLFAAHGQNFMAYDHTDKKWKDPSCIMATFT